MIYDEWYDNEDRCLVIALYLIYNLRGDWPMALDKPTTAIFRSLGPQAFTLITLEPWGVTESCKKLAIFVQLELSISDPKAFVNLPPCAPLTGPSRGVPPLRPSYLRRMDARISHRQTDNGPIHP